jgi:hypothetical protein
MILMDSGGLIQQKHGVQQVQQAPTVLHVPGGGIATRLSLH